MLNKNKPIRRELTNKTRNALIGYGFVAIWIIGFFALTLYPTIYSILLGLNDVKITPQGMLFSWKGLYHFKYALNEDLYFKTSLGTTVLFIACSTPVIVVFSLIIALLLNGKYPLRMFYRVIFFLPVIIMSGPVISRLLSNYSLDFSTDLPVVYTFLETMPSVIQKPALFILENLTIILWFSGVQILLFLASLQKISPNLYEAADIDGAGGWEKFWKITLPHVAPIALLVTIYTVVDIANDSSMAVNTRITDMMFNQTRLYSASAAMSWIYFIVLALLLVAVYLIFFLLGRKGKNEAKK